MKESISFTTMPSCVRQARVTRSQRVPMWTATKTKMGKKERAETGSLNYYQRETLRSPAQDPSLGFGSLYLWRTARIPRKVRFPQEHASWRDKVLQTQPSHVCLNTNWQTTPEGNADFFSHLNLQGCEPKNATWEPGWLLFLYVVFYFCASTGWL